MGSKMPSTYTLIASTTVTAASASTIDFSSIPSTYTDLLVRFSVRMNQNLVDSPVYVVLNNDNTVQYTGTNLIGTGSAATSARISDAAAYLGKAPSSNATANTFSNGEFYLPNYTVTQTRQISSYQVAENNATAATLSLYANYYRGGTTAINQLTFFGDANFVTNSSFYLYGIKNS